MKRNIFFQFVIWYFWKVPINIILAFKNFLRFNLEFFSVLELIKTFFTPWKRYQEQHSVAFNLNNRIQVLIGNLISRGMGMFIRSILIIIGLLSEALIFVIGLGVLAGWLSLFIWLWLGLAQGFRYLFLYYYA